jgi:hypothetical protein
MDDMDIISVEDWGQDFLPAMESYERLAKAGAERLKSQATELQAAGNEAEVKDQETLEKAAKLLGEVKGFQKAFEAARKRAVGPLNELSGRINEAAYEVFHPTKKLGLLAEAEKALKDKIGAYQRAEEDRQRQEAIRLQEQEMHHAHEEGREPARLPLAQPTPPKAKGVHTAKRWVFKVLDLGLLREEYVEPNTKAIQGLVNSLGKKAEKAVTLPGSQFMAIEATEETDIRARAT